MNSIPQTDGKSVVSSNRSRRLTHLDRVKDTFPNKPEVIEEYINILEQFYLKEIPAHQMITKLSRLFKGYDDLILDLNQFVSHEYVITIQNGKVFFTRSEPESNTANKLTFFDSHGMILKIQRHFHDKEKFHLFTETLELAFDENGSMKDPFAVEEVFKKIKILLANEQLYNELKGLALPTYCSMENLRRERVHIFLEKVKTQTGERYAELMSLLASYFKELKRNENGKIELTSEVDHKIKELLEEELLIQEFEDFKKFMCCQSTDSISVETSSTDG